MAEYNEKSDLAARYESRTVKKNNNNNEILLLTLTPY